ncbi:hypothetical protein ACQJBY_031580 [Aegilops geniculata]
MLLCRAVITGWDGDLAFLFNVLSVMTFSVQEHPYREVLHAMRLGMYCNADHMAKMAVAVTEFRALCSSLNPDAETKRRVPWDHEVYKAKEELHHLLSSKILFFLLGNERIECKIALLQGQRVDHHLQFLRFPVCIRHSQQAPGCGFGSAQTLSSVVSRSSHMFFI